MIRKTLLAATIALASLGATPMQSPNPVTSVVRTADRAHILGDPAAEHALVEYVSYTCGHCAAFEREGAERVKLQYVATGRMRLEIRNYWLNIADIAIGTAMQCLPADRFFTAHSAMLRRQDEWIPGYRNATPAQQARWTTGTPRQQLQAVASDIGLYDIMENHGLSRPALDQCFGDKAMYAPILAQTEDAERRGIDGTPTFELDGEVLRTNSAQGVLQALATAVAPRI